MKAIILLAAVAVLVAVPAAEAAANCGYFSYDLSSVAGSDISYTSTAPNFSYKWVMDICGATSTGAAQCAGSALCQMSAAGGFQAIIARWDSTAQWAICAAVTGGVCPNQGVVATFSNGDSCSSGGKRSAVFTFPCDSTQTGTPAVASITEPTGTCQYLVTMKGNAAFCEGAGGSGGGSSGGISGGTVFLIIFFVTFPVYVIVGCLYKRLKMGTTGMESCPNVDFWRDLPALIKDGFSFTWRKLTGLCGKGGDGSYENVK